MMLIKATRMIRDANIILSRCSSVLGTVMPLIQATDAGNAKCDNLGNWLNNEWRTFNRDDTD